MVPCLLAALLPVALAHRAAPDHTTSVRAALVPVPAWATVAPSPLVTTTLAMIPQKRQVTTTTQARRAYPSPRPARASRTTVPQARPQAPRAAPAPAPLPQDTTGWAVAQASFYGPGFYGQGTACGQRMTPTLQGVAHRSLPCGTLVTFAHDGVEVTVPVVDRGPYVGGRLWDLTAATCQQLRHCFTGSIRWRR